MFDPIMEQILAIARDAWAFMAGLLIVVALLGGLYYVLQGTAGAAFGASRMTSMAIIGVVGLVIIVLFAFLFLPQIGELLHKFQPKAPF
ncbi:MAG: hypothetical protein DPW18_01625 [Chloroflexi bacterium]|jgi:hypothetical protein|nr:hypothetical protein [Chloroflexota bacterium]MDL1943715.1 hypothetical protein [Chloroflexi bacterium CFX2]